MSRLEFYDEDENVYMRVLVDASSAEVMLAAAHERMAERQATIGGGVEASLMQAVRSGGGITISGPGEYVGKYAELMGWYAENTTVAASAMEQPLERIEKGERAMGLRQEFEVAKSGLEEVRYFHVHTDEVINGFWLECQDPE